MSENRKLSDQYMLRLPDGMRDRIKFAAAENGRSMNAEIVATLEDKYPDPNSQKEFIAAVIALILHAKTAEELRKAALRSVDKMKRDGLSEENIAIIMRLHDLRLEQLGLPPLDLDESP